MVLGMAGSGKIWLKGTKEHRDREAEKAHARALEGGRLAGRATGFGPPPSPWTVGTRSSSPTDSDLFASTRPPSRLFRTSPPGSRARTCPPASPHLLRGEGGGGSLEVKAGPSCTSPPYSMHWSGGAIELRPRACGEDLGLITSMGGATGLRSPPGANSDLGMGALVTVNASQVLSVTD